MDYPTPYVLKQTDAIAPVRDALSPDALGEKKDDDSNFLDDERESSPSALENSVHAGIANIPFKWRALALVTAITFSSGQECASTQLCPSRCRNLDLIHPMRRGRLTRQGPTPLSARSRTHCATSSGSTIPSTA